MSSPLATERGKVFALEVLRKRREENAGKERINNSRLPAGDPMYYYCKACGGLADALPEGWFLGGPKKLCDECQALKDLGWLE